MQAGLHHPHPLHAEVYVLSKDEAVVTPRSSTTTVRSSTSAPPDVTGSIDLPAGDGDGHAGRQHQMTVKLIAPIAMEEGLRFAIREGGRTVGAGVVAKIIE